MIPQFMKHNTVLGKIIHLYWILVLASGSLFFLSNFYEYFRKLDNEFPGNIFFQSLGLMAIVLLIIPLVKGLLKGNSHSIDTLKLLSKISFALFIGALGCVALHLSGLLLFPNIYQTLALCSFIFLTGWLTNLWIKRNCPA
ncbi:MAG TPA: hypothetical protein VEV16_09335 [Daejeonella sp.]|nr:hypothetical protein [Daejeonella sp.]